MNYVKSQIDEISKDRVLLWFGFFLSIAHIITAHNWIMNDTWQLFLPDNHRIMCFPFWTECRLFVSSSSNFLKSIFYFYLISAVPISAFFLFKKNYTTYAYYGLMFLSALKMLIIASRYNVMGNYHTMHLITCVVFVIFTQKRILIPVFLCLFYFCAGLLKLNEEWMSGASLIRFPVFLSQYVTLSLAYVIALELVLIWGLLSSKFKLRFITFVQLVIFHIYSYFIVGYYYPAIMFCLLTIIWLPWIIEKNFTFNVVSLKKINFLPCAFLLIVNIYPKFVYDDTALHGERRFLRFHMLDARTECNKIFLVEANNLVKSITLPHMTNAIRTKCDPVSYQSLTKTICDHLSPGEKLKVFIESKRSTDKKYKTVWDDKNVCSN